MAKKEYFPHIHTILQLVISLPVSTAEVERSFSALNRLKTVGRSSMGEARLNGLALAYVHKTMDISPEEIMKIWNSKGEHRTLNVFKS